MQKGEPNEFMEFIVMRRPSDTVLFHYHYCDLIIHGRLGHRQSSLTLSLRVSR